MCSGWRNRRWRSRHRRCSGNLKRRIVAGQTLTSSTVELGSAQLEALWSVVGALREHVERVTSENEELREQVTDLLERGGKSSRTSSKPPSSDSPAQRASRPGERRTGRSKGAQPGHEKHERAALPETDVDEVRRYFPPGRCRCGADVVPAAEPHCRHQVFDLPEVRATVTESGEYASELVRGASLARDERRGGRARGVRRDVPRRERYDASDSRRCPASLPAPGLR